MSGPAPTHSLLLTEWQPDRQTGKQDSKEIQTGEDDADRRGQHRQERAIQTVEDNTEKRQNTDNLPHNTLSIPTHPTFFYSSCPRANIFTWLARLQHIHIDTSVATSVTTGPDGLHWFLHVYIHRHCPWPPVLRPVSQLEEERRWRRLSTRTQCHRASHENARTAHRELAKYF